MHFNINNNKKITSDNAFDYIVDLQCKIITLEQEIERLQKLNDNQALQINSKLTHDNVFEYQYKKVKDPYTKKERIIAMTTPQSHQYYVSNNTNSI